MSNGYGELRLINRSPHTGEQTRILAQREPAEYEPVVMERGERRVGGRASQSSTTYSRQKGIGFLLALIFG